METMCNHETIADSQSEWFPGSDYPRRRKDCENNNGDIGDKRNETSFANETSGGLSSGQSGHEAVPELGWLCRIRIAGSSVVAFAVRTRSFLVLVAIGRR